MKLSIVFVLAALAGAASAQNLVANGDFSQGNTGFTSGLRYVAPASDALRPEGVYTIVANTTSPDVLNLNGTVGYFDHTTGNASGAMLAVNGSTSPGSTVWQQIVSGLVVGQSYDFSTFVSRWTPNGGPAASLAFVVGGRQIGAFEDPSTPGIWMRQSARFVATASLVTFEIRDLMDSASGIGNDFALDDIRVQAVPEPTTIAALGLGALGLIRRRRKA